MLWENSLGAMQATYLVRGAQELTIVGSDIESYGACAEEAVVQVEDAGAVRLWGLHGRAICHDLQNISSPPDFGVLDIGAESFLNIFPVLSRVLGGKETEQHALPTVTYQPSLASLVGFGSPGVAGTEIADRAKGAFRLGVSMWDVPTVDNASVPIDTGRPVLTAAQAGKVASLVYPTKAGRQGAAWGLPSFDATSNRWREAARKAAAHVHALPALSAHQRAKDDSAMIQAIIDATPNASKTLPAGTYHIANPLRLGGTSFLVGAGPDKTFIFALDPAMSMVVGNGRGGSYTLNLAGVTLSGGAYGIHMSAATFGSHAQVTGSWVSHVVLANMSSAGIYVDDIYGVDNNLFSHLTFDGCKVAFYQYAPASQREPGKEQCKQAFDNPNLDYMDKTVFYRTHIVGQPHAKLGSRGSGFVLDPCRGDNLNMWFESSFEHLDDALSLSGQQTINYNINDLNSSKLRAIICRTCRVLIKLSVISTADKTSSAPDKLAKIDSNGKYLLNFINADKIWGAGPANNGSNL